MTEFRFEHIHLRSADPEATAAWYERMFGARIVRGRQPDGSPRVDLKLGGIDVFIFHCKPGDGTRPAPITPYFGLDHFGLQVDDLDAAMTELNARGCEFTRGPVTVRPGLRVAFLRAPEEVSIEILERKA
jgi:catechol 2,3-dioxygenase-like lactoylglutathione lyase family enzyme